MYKMTDRSLYGARPPFIKIFAKEEKLDGMSADELVKRVGMTMLNNSTDDCNCGAFETEVDCEESAVGCQWRPLFESCHPPELIDGNEPICSTTEAPTMAPTLSLPADDSTDSPTADSFDANDDNSQKEEDSAPPEPDPWYTNMFKSREHDAATTESNSTANDYHLDTDDDEIILQPDLRERRKLATDMQDTWYETNHLDEKNIPGKSNTRT